MSLKSQNRDTSLKSLSEEKIHRPQPGLNPRTLDLEASSLPRDHRGQLHGLKHDTLNSYREIQRWFNSR